MRLTIKIAFLIVPRLLHARQLIPTVPLPQEIHFIVSKTEISLIHLTVGKVIHAEMVHQHLWKSAFALLELCGVAHTIALMMRKQFVCINDHSGFKIDYLTDQKLFFPG